MNEIIQRKIQLLPDRPGSYQMKDARGTIIYVGKAKSLVKRVKQYFTRPQVGKVARMVAEIADFDIIETSSEKESLLLEINLIQKYYPKYNILLKDGKMYPYIAVRKNGMPQLKIAHKPNDRKNYDYFGPYPNSSAAYKVIDILNMCYPIMEAGRSKDSSNLYLYLHELMYPEQAKGSKVDPEFVRRRVVAFLKGDTSEVIATYRKQMVQAAEDLNFERAADLKHKIEDIESTTQSQKIMMKDRVDRDVFAYSTREGYIAMLFLLYRKGVLLGKNLYVEEISEELEDELSSAIVQFYSSHPKPKELILADKSLAEELSAALEIDVTVPTRGMKKDLLSMALENAKQGLDQHFMTARLEDDVLALLGQLQEQLHMDHPPLEIELFDNAHTQGQDAIGGMVTFVNGQRAPELYRRFNIQQPNRADDMASMREVIYRRCSRIVHDNLKAPDLIIVDGGEIQVTAAREAMDAAGIQGVKLAGLVKNDKHETNALMDGDTGELIPLDKRSPLFFLLMRMQDEVHRYAITAHRGKRAKSLFSTFFDDIPGVGPKRRERLLDAYPTMESLFSASIGELEQLTDARSAQAIAAKIAQLKSERQRIDDSVAKAQHRGEKAAESGSFHSSDSGLE